MGASEFVERSKANFVRAIGNRWAQTGESTAATVIKEARQAVAVTEEAAKEALPVLARSGASRAAQRGFTSVAPMLGIAGAGLDLLLGAGAYKEAKHDVEHKDYARALSSGAGVAASATSLVARGAAAFTGVSSVSLTASVGTFGTGEAIAAAPHVVGAFAVGAAIGVGIQEGSAYLSKKYLGTEISPGQMIGDTLTAVDRKVSGLISDPSKLGWKIANWLTPTSN